MRKSLYALQLRTHIIQKENDLNAINPELRYILQEIIRLLDIALPKEVEPD